MSNILKATFDHLDQLATWFTPARAEHDERQLSANLLLVYISLITSVFSLLYVAISLVIGFDIGAILMLVCFVLLFAILFLFRANGFFRLSANLYLANCFFFAVLGCSFFTGGLHSMVFPWFVLIPVAGVLLLGYCLDTLIWGLLSCAITLAFGLASMLGFQFPELYHLEFTNLFYTICVSGLVIILFFIALAFDQNRNIAMKKILEQNDTLQQTQEQRKKAEEELWESRQRYQGLVETLYDWIWEVDPQGHYTYISPRIKDILGYEPEELLGKTPFELMPTEEVQRVLEIFGSLTAEQKPIIDLENINLHKDGHPVVMETSGLPFYDSKGNFKGYRGTDRNITKRKRAEEALQESEARFRAIFMQAAVGVAEIEMVTGRFLIVNQCLCEMVGRTEEEMLATTFQSITHPEDLHLHEEKTALLMDGNVSHYSLEKRYIRKDGAIIWVNLTSSPLWKPGEVPTRNLIVVQDITEDKHAEAAKAILEAQTRQLQKADSLGRMAGAIAHHFNNQLGVVIGNLEMAIDDLPHGAGPANRLTTAMQAAWKAAEMSGLMLTYLGQSFDKLEPLDLSDACRRGLPMLRAAMPGKVVLETDLPSPGPVISANENQIQQVLTNLVINAWEAIGEGRGAIHLSIKTISPAEIPVAYRLPIGWQSQDSAYAGMEVKDAGCGIADKDIEKLFDPFFSSKFTGRGLGLSVVLGIVKAHDGAVTVESEPGRGSTFRVFLPVSGEEVLRQPNKGNYGDALLQGVPVIPSSIKTEGSGTVLLVEDEEMVRDVAAAMLKHLGFTVLEAKDGIEAVEVFRQRQNEIRLVLCDLTMPRMNGWETLTALRNLAPDIPVILASGYDKAQVMAGDHPELPQVFLGKPYKLKGLSDAISQALVSKKK